MKKKTKFKLKNSHRIPFRITITVCLIGAAGTYNLFHNSFFRALTKLDEEPIATITFKHKTAERKFLNRVIWDRLKQNSPIYNGDIIHTADLSEATVYFEDGTILDLAENTMAQVFMHSDGILQAELNSGSAGLTAGTENRGLKLKSSDSEVFIGSNSKIFAKKESKNELQISMEKGNAQFADGEIISEGKSLSISKGIKTELPFNLISPAQNEKILYFTNNLYPVNFKWTSEKGTPLTLIIAEDKQFTKITKILQTFGSTESSVNLAKGTYYWKLKESNAGNSSENPDEYVLYGKFQLIQSIKPELVVPAENFLYSFRKQKPSIRFIWNECEAASAYNFEVSDNQDMKNPHLTQRISGTSLIISTLGAGTWYYRVTPFYAINNIGLQNPSEIRSFRIEQRDKLSIPVLTSPSNNEFLDKTRALSSFSWKMQNEPMTYKISISNDKNMHSPLIIRQSIDNFINFTSEELKTLPDGQYYWQITQTDNEGNESEPSKIRTFYAINGKLEQRPIFPPEEYSIWKPLLSDIRFTWKTNLELEQFIQVSSDENFKKLIIDEAVSGQSFKVTNLEEGDYFWRITTKDENFQHSSEKRKFSVVSEFNAPEIITPGKDKKAVIRPNQPYNFSWQPEENLDYYRLKLYKNNSTEAFYDENFISDSNISIVMENLEEGLYRYELQGYSVENDSNTRRSSMTRESSFVLRKIKPVTQLTPENGTHIGGWEAIEHPPLLTWTSRESFSNAEIILSKKSGIEAEEKHYKQKNFSYQLPALSSGQYEWQIKALSSDQLDISSVQTFTFYVDEIPPFDAPKNARTEGGSLFNAEYLRKTPYIVFNWQSVARAENYLLEILNKKNKVVHKAVIDKSSAPSYKLESLSKLERGNFKWRIRACKMTPDKNEILIDGRTAEGTFTIDYNLKENGGKHKDKGALYAK